MMTASLLILDTLVVGTILGALVKVLYACRR